MAQGVKLNFLRRHPFITVFSTALVLRVMFAIFYLSSPFRFFHEVPGLDMETLLRFGEWGTPGNSFFFTLHRLQVFLFWKLNGGTHPVIWHVLWQALLGSAGAGLLSEIMLKISGKSHLALLAGVVWALNPVELMYEFTTLQETLVNFGIILSFWSFLKARQHRFAPLYALGAGCAAGVAATGRPVAVGMTLLLGAWCAFYLYRKKLSLKGALAYGCGILLVWGIFSTVNFCQGSRFNCFFNPVSYAVSVNTAPPAAAEKLSSPTAAPALPPLVTTAFKMFKRIPGLWSPGEIPENLNIYFLKDKIPFLRIPHEFLPLCAAMGLLFLLIKGEWKRKTALILLPIVSLSFFLCIREPIGRDRLLLLPWFVLLTVWFFHCLSKKNKYFAVSLMLLPLIFHLTTLSSPPLRAADFSAWGWALEKESRAITPEVIKYFQAAFALKPESSNAVALITRAMKTDRRELAQKSAAIWMKTSGNAPLAYYYGALAAYPEYGAMKKFLALVKEEELPPLFRFRFFMMQGECALKTCDRAGALKFYRSALRIPEGTPAQRQYAEKTVQQLEKQKND